MVLSGPRYLELAEHLVPLVRQRGKVRRHQLDVPDL